MEHTYGILSEPLLLHHHWQPKIYRRHTIRFTRPTKTTVAVVYSNGYKVHEAYADTITDAMRQAKSWIDQQLLINEDGKIGH